MKGPLRTPKALGIAIRAQRKRLGATQAQLAGLAAVGTRFVSEVEQGKPTAEWGKVIRLLDRLGLRIYLDEASQP